MTVNANRRYRSSATVQFDKIDEYLDPILETIAAHDMTVEKSGLVHYIHCPFGEATFEVCKGGFKLTVESTDPVDINQLKYALVGPIGFIAARENLDIQWEGDHTAPSLPDNLRTLHVTAIENISPRFRRITFKGEDIGGYDRDDQLHCRLIFQPRGIATPLWPMLNHLGHVVWPKQSAVPTRVYTIRSIDVKRQEIVIDFSLHPNAGPATRWAMDARTGDLIGILGPAANGPKSAKFYVLAGDETALPGIARILEFISPEARGHAFIEVDTQADELPLKSPSGLTIHWLHRNGAAAGTTSLLQDAVATVDWPQDRQEAFFWGGCEHKAFSAIHHHLRKVVKLSKDRFVLYSHWHRTLSEEQIIEQGADAYLPQ
jgi:NADPH-dependent ferric siderophore reductase